MTCVPGPAFDCCEGDGAPAHRLSDEHQTDRQIAVRSDRPSLPVTTDRNPTRSASATDSGIRGATETPLYTLLATLLI